MLKKINVTVIVLGIITIVDLVVTEGSGATLMLWILYGIYKFLTHPNVNIG